MEESIIYFDEPGPKNTQSIINVVKNRLKKKDIQHVVVATESGNTALKIADELKHTDVNIVAVAPYAGYRNVLQQKQPDRKWHFMDKKMYSKLDALGVKILDRTSWIFGCTLDSAFLKGHAPAGIIHRFISRMFGFGIKTCIEIALIASDAGVVPFGSEAIAIAGTGWLGRGADAALVFKSAPVYEGAFLKNDGGMEVLEILAMPRVKFSDRLISMMKKAGKDEP